jgi:virginiamycin B lyase
VPEEATSGKWSGEPAPTLTFQWRRCNAAGAECVNISGATANSYTPGEADVSKTLVMAVTATNPFGSTTAYSAPTEKVRQLGQITEYALPAGSHPNSITRGPDGNFWYSGSASNQIGRITPTGTVTEVSTEGITPAGMASGGAKVWFAGTSKTAANMTTEGAITKFPTAQGSVVDVAWGADLRAWFTATEGSLIAIMKGGALTEYALPAGTSPGRIAKGPDGNLWFTDGASSNKIDKSTTSGVVTKYSLPSGDLPWDVAAGPDGNVWLTIPNGTTGKIGKMTTSGTLTEYSLPGTSPYPQGISPGPDGNVWFTMKNADTIGKITPSGKITTYSLPVGSAPQEIVEGGDGTLWFTEPGTGKIGVIVA